MNAISYHSSRILISITDSTSSAETLQGNTNSYFTLRTKYFKVWFCCKQILHAVTCECQIIKIRQQTPILENKRNMGIPCIYSLANIASTVICENTLFIRRNKNVCTFGTLHFLYAFFWVIPRCLKYMCRRFGTLCLFHLHRQVGACRMNSAEGNVGVLYGKKHTTFSTRQKFEIKKVCIEVASSRNFAEKLLF